MVLKNKNFKLNDGIQDYNIKDPVTLKVKEFYQEDPFPNYKIDDNKHTILQAGDNNWLMKELKEFIGFNKFILEVGSGTCQLSNYLAIGTNNQIYAFDSSLQSLKLGKEFAEKSNIQNMNFVRGDIFDKIFEDEVFDFVWCTYDINNHIANLTMSFLKEFWDFLRVRKKYWLLPIIIILVLFGGLIILSQGSVVAPFIYTIF